MRKLFMQELLKELKESKFNNKDTKKILLLIEDILQFFEKENIEDYEMNQEIIGMQEIFHGYVVRVQIETNFGTNKYRKLNKIITRKYV